MNNFPYILTIIPFSDFMRGVMYDNNLTLRQAMFHEMHDLLTHTYAGRCPSVAFNGNDPRSRVYWKYFLTAYMCREKDIPFYINIMESSLLDYTYSEFTPQKVNTTRKN